MVNDNKYGDEAMGKKRIAKKDRTANYGKSSEENNTGKTGLSSEGGIFRLTAEKLMKRGYKTIEGSEGMGLRDNDAEADKKYGPNYGTCN